MMTIILIVLAGFFMAAGGMMYVPIMPIQAASMGAPTWVQTSIPMGLPLLICLVLLFPIAILADKTGKRKELLLVATLLTCLANIGLGIFTKSWVSLTILRIISGIPFAFFSMIGVVLAFVLPPEKRGMAMGLGIGSAMLGIGVFQGICGTLFELMGKSYSNIYFFAAGISALAFLFLLPAKIPVVKSTEAISGKEIKEVLTNKNIWITGITLCIYLLGWQMIYGSFPVVVTKTLGASVELESALFAVAAIMLGFGTFVWGPIIDKIGGRNSLLLGISASFISIFVMIFASHVLWPYVILFWIVTLGGVCGAPASTTIATQSLKPEFATMAANFMFIFVCVPGIVGGFFAGPIIDATGLMGMLIAAAVCAIIGDLLMLKIPSKIEGPDQTIAR